MWKKHRILTILLACTLILSIIVTGFGWPGFLLGLIPTDKAYDIRPSKEGLKFAYGNSKAFEINPLPGMTISAEENALDKDRTFKVRDATEKEFDKLASFYEENIKESGVIMNVWDIDAGLKSDENLPGTYKVALNMKEMGISEENYENCRFYRVDSDGKWYEYACGVEGDSVYMESSQNSLILWTIIIAVPVFDMIYRNNADMYHLPELRKSLHLRNIDSYDLEVDGKKDRFRIILDIGSVKDTLFKLGEEMKTAQKHAAVRALADTIRESSVPEDIKDPVIKSLPDEIELHRIPNDLHIAMKPYENKFKDEAQYAKMRDSIVDKTAKKISEYVKDEPEYKKNQEYIDGIKKDSPKLEELKNSFEQVNLVAKYLETAYFYLKDQVKVTMPTTVVEVHLSDAKSSDNAGVATTPLFDYAKIIRTNFKVVAIGTMPLVAMLSGQKLTLDDLNILANPALVISMASIADKEPKSYDELLLTMVHELFHIVERQYVMSIRANYGFDEMLAQSVEYDAYNYFLANKTISTTDGHLENLAKVQYYGIPLDEYYAIYPEGVFGLEEDWINPLIGKGADVSYGRAGLLIYLRKKFNTSYDDILKRYKALWRKGRVTTIMKNVFTESSALVSQPDKALTFYYDHYVTSEEMSAKLQNRADSGNFKIFSPRTELKDNKERVRLTHFDYSTRIRRIYLPEDTNKDKKEEPEYALIVKMDQLAQNADTDIRLKPLNRTKDKDYVNIKGGFFIRPRKYPKFREPKKDEKLPAKTTEYIMEVIGGDYGSFNLPNRIFYYEVCPLTALPEPEMVNKNGILEVKGISRPAYKRTTVDRIVATVTLNDRVLKTEDKLYGFWGNIREWKIDLSDLEVDGKPLTEKQKKDLKITFRECVKDTWDKEDPEKACLGPGEKFNVPVGFDITGTYNTKVTVNNFELGEGVYTLVGGLAAGIARMFGADPTEDQIRDAVNSGVEWNVESFDYDQTVTVSRVSKDRYKVEIKAEGYGDLVYQGTLDEDNVLSIKLKKFSSLKNNVSSEEGISLSMEEFLGKISLSFHQNDDGEVYIDGSCDIVTGILKALYTCSGYKDMEE